MLRRFDGGAHGSGAHVERGAGGGVTSVGAQHGTAHPPPLPPNRLPQTTASQLTRSSLGKFYKLVICTY